jgi:hypothetical protein
MRAFRALPRGAGLFPQEPRAVGLSRPGHRVLFVGLQVIAVAIATVLLLYRVAVVPAWDCVYAEDAGIFLVQSLASPWHLLVPYNGYLQFLPRVLAQGVSLMPLPRAGFAFAILGAAIASGCALFTYHASAGYIGSRTLRAVLALTLILLPIAPLELADNGVNTPWYLMIALFWAVLWRPRSLFGQVTSAVIAFLTVMSSPLAIVFAPLLAVRVFSLRSVRENVVTIGWVLGWPLQLYVIMLSYSSGTQRVGSLAPLGASSYYYMRTVVLRVFGWHVSWDLVRAVGTPWSTVLFGLVLAALLGLAWMAGGRRTRAFVILAVVFGFVFTVFAATITSYIAGQTPFESPVSFEPASRYSALPLVLLYAALIAGVDSFADRHGGFRKAITVVLHGVFPALRRERFSTVLRGPRSRPVAVVLVAAALVGLLSIGWVTDYSYPTQRTSNGPWLPIAVKWLDHCRHHETIKLPEWAGNGTLKYIPVSCSRLIS